MRSVLMDTDVVSFLFKGDTRAELYHSQLDDALQLISFMTLAELEKWPLWRNWGEARRQRLEDYLKRFTLILPDRSLCKQWAQVSSQVQRDGRMIETADAWIAATAILYDVPLVTHNRGHYISVQGLTVISEAPA